MRCAFCHDDLLTQPWTCPACDTRLHPECRRLMGLGCATLGCTGKARRSQPVPRRVGGTGTWETMALALATATVSGLALLVAVVIFAVASAFRAGHPVEGVRGVLGLLALGHLVGVPALWLPGHLRRLGYRGSPLQVYLAGAAWIFAAYLCLLLPGYVGTVFLESFSPLLLIVATLGAVVFLPAVAAGLALRLAALWSSPPAGRAGLLPAPPPARLRITVRAAERDLVKTA